MIIYFYNKPKKQLRVYNNFELLCIEEGVLRVDTCPRLMFDNSIEGDVYQYSHDLDWMYQTNKRLVFQLSSSNINIPPYDQVLIYDSTCGSQYDDQENLRRLSQAWNFDNYKRKR